MSYETEITEANVEPQYLINLMLDKCARVYGVSPCVAGVVRSNTVVTATAQSITLDAGASASNGAYTPMTIRITAGPGVGEEKKIINYIGATKKATPDTPWIVTPTGASTYDIINRPIACFNKRKTCQDPTNYSGTATQEIKFCMHDRALPLSGETVRPYIQNAPQQAAGAIDPRKAVIRHTAMDFDMSDEPDTDVGLDPYLADRTYTPEDQGTFATKQWTRDPFYSGRDAEIKHGVAGQAEADYKLFRMIIESIQFKSGGNWTLTLKDKLKLLDKAELPIATDAVAVGAITSGAATFPTSDGTQFIDPAVSGRKEYFSVDEIVIRYTGITGNNLTGCTWGKFNTIAANVADGAKLQQGWGYELENVANMIHDALNDGGIADADINTTELASERDLWLNNALLTGIEIKPRKLKNIVQDLMFVGMCSVFWDAYTQKVRLKVTAPPTPSDSSVSLRDVDFKDELPELDLNESSRLSRSTMWYNRRTPFDTGREKWQSYFNGFQKRDADAESADQFGEPAIENIFSVWVATDLWAERVIRRWVSRFRNRASILRFTMSIKDSLMAPADIIKITTKVVVDFFGAAVPERFWQVTSRAQSSEGSFDYECLDTNWAPGGVDGGMYAFIQSSTPTPPDWATATTANKKYGYIGDSDNKLGTEKTEGYYIF